MFSGIFLLFPARAHPIAGTIAGIMAVLAPTVGPVVGGWITHHYSWPWLFLINVVPGVIAAIATPFLLPRGRPRLNQSEEFRRILAGADGDGTGEPGDRLEASAAPWLVLRSLLRSVRALRGRDGVCSSIRTLKAVQPVVELATLRVRSFAVGCALSFCLGVGLFGAVYLMPVFLAYVRQHDALQIGSIMLVTGAAQLVAAPIAARWRAGSIRAGCRRSDSACSPSGWA